ncbi:MAG TPA: hypothetical protein VI298_02225 [Geobacteraceae bacterium]
MREERRHFWLRALLPALLLALWCLMPNPQARAAFESGSTCGAAFHNTTTCRGAFAPSVTTTVQLPPSGIIDYTTFYVPQGVTVSFAKNQANTPVIIRCSGNVLIEGIINVSGSGAAATGTAGDGVLGDDGQPGLGGPGGYDGGLGGRSTLFGGGTAQTGGPGKGPGGGQSIGCTTYNDNSHGCGGGAGAFATSEGAVSYAGANGSTYGQGTLLPLIGGSGGGGGASGATYSGAGGGGGGGAILIASSGAITVGKSGVSGAGRIYANGGSGGSTGSDAGAGGPGGGGSGGGIRLIADSIWRVQDGYLYAQRGGYGTGYYNSAYGGYGRIRLEANNTNWAGYSDPGFSFGLPGKVLVPNNPFLSITSVGGQPVPANPTGVGDVNLPQGTTSATVTLAANNIPRNTTVMVYVVPAIGGTRTSVTSTPLDGASDDATTASAQVTLRDGNNAIFATATYTVTEQLALALPRFGGEYVARIRVETDMGGSSRIVYITASGKEYRTEEAGKS